MANNKKSLKSESRTAVTLTEYLKEKGRSHNHYKTYSKMERIIPIRDNLNLYLGSPSTWNDKVDRKQFLNDSAYRYFIKCFSFSAEESMAMWMLYGGIDNKGGMIDFSKKGINSILQAKEITLGKFDNGFQPIKKLTNENFEIYITDVLYYKDYKENKKGCFVKRSDESCYNRSARVLAKLFGCKKSYPWEYENECRMIIKLDKNLVPADCTDAEIDLSQMDLGVSLKRVYHSPNYPLDDKKGTTRSSIFDTVDWDLIK